MTVELIFSIVAVIIGALSLLASYRANRRVSQMKSLDLRLELKKLLTEVSLDLSQLPLTMSGYCNSWRMHWASKHMGNQGISNVAGEEAGRDGAEISKLRQALPENKGHEDRSEKELEDLIVKVHGIQLRVVAIKEKYAKKILDLELERRKHQEELLANRRVQQQELLAKHRDPNSALDVLRYNDIKDGRF